MTEDLEPRPARPMYSDRNLRRRNAVVLAAIAVVLGVMITLVSYSVTIYRLFCAATGYGGTTERVAENDAKQSGRTITVRFDTSIVPGMPWRFVPAQKQVTVHLGEQALVYFDATNLADHPVVGHATYNVTPDVVGRYFKKIQCFCFDEERLGAHESVEMPVLFYVDPDMESDRDANYIDTVTLAYTFFPSADPGAAADLARFKEIPPAGAAASAERGHQLFVATCSACHSFDRNAAGPSLAGIFGRPAASAAGYDYSSALRAERFAWSGARLDQWLADPQVAVPGAKMPVHVADAHDRRDIIAYLKLVTEQSQAATGVTAIR